MYYEGARKLNRLERWLATLCEPSTSKAKKIAEGDEYCMAYIDERKVLLTTDDLREAYDHAKAEKEAIRRQAENRGRASGIKIGQEHIIKQLKKAGVSSEIIASLNNLTLDKT